MHRQPKAGITVAALATLMAVVLAAAPTQAASFNVPPETQHPDWVTSFPYQRNILVDFTTNPSTWPDDPTSPIPGARKDLLPNVSAHHEGWDDPVLYPTDWFAWEGPLVWSDTDPTGQGRQGIVGLESSAPDDLDLIWHIDNWDRPWMEKHFFVEAEFYTTDNDGLDQLISSTGQIEILNPNYVVLADGWVRWWSWATLIPNPLYEEMINTISLNPQQVPGAVYVDYFHIATECVPAPSIGAGGLALLSGLGLMRRRRTS